MAHLLYDTTKGISEYFKDRKGKDILKHLYNNQFY
jgi:hypothetical protein